MVDFVRSCYVGTWLPFANDATKVVRGRYYRAPAGTPVYPGFHRYGSRNWYDSNWRVEQTPGEQLTAKQTWDPGAPPQRLPLAVLRGSATCIANGADVGQARTAADFIDGFLSSCWQLTPLEQAFLELTAIDRCAVQRACANIVSWLYDADLARLEAFFRAWLGPAPVLTYHAPAGATPAMYTVMTTAWAAVFVNGTQTFQQLALQGWQSLDSPVDQGGFSTMPLWYGTAQTLNATLEADGLQPNMPVFFCGHSYGGAVVCILAAMYRLNDGNRGLTALTFGMPKVGDVRLVQTLSTVRTIHVCNDTDLVTILPLSTPTLCLYIAVFGASIALRWEGWDKATPQLVLADDGSGEYADPPLPDYATAVALIARALAHIPENPLDAHQISTYVTRLNRRCPNVVWPLPADANDFFAAADTYTLALRGRPKIPFTGIMALVGTLPPGGALALTAGANPAAESLLSLGTLTTIAIGSLALTYRPIGPGDNCDDSLELQDGVPFAFTTSQPTPQWYKFPIENGTTYFLSFNVTDWTNFSLAWSHGPDCSSLTPIFPQPSSLSTCEEYVAAADEFMYCLCNGSLFGDTDYEITMGAGTCP